MRPESGEPSDPQWELALEIASRLWYSGVHTIDLDPSPHQRLVDVQWAARQAGRLLGVRARSTVSLPRSRTDPTVTINITFEDLDGRSRSRAEVGFERLLNSVREQRKQ